jgi:hypothetical protein
VQLGLPYASDVLASDNLRSAKRILEDPEYDSAFLDKTGFTSAVGGVAGLGAAMTSNQVSVFNISLDAASLVFMHSTLDASVQDLCIVCPLVAPSDWEAFVAERKVSLAETKAADYQELFKRKLSQHLEALEKESLVKRVDRLFQLCKPSGDYVRRGYSYDRQRLEQIDRDRQAVIHGDGVLLINCEAALEFLLETGLFLFGMVNHRYGVRMDPQLVTESHGWAKLSPNKPLQPPSGG